MPGTPHAALAHTGYASQVVDRVVPHLTDLSASEAGEVYAAARAAQQDTQAA